jgi:hypothetical protein
MSSKFGATPLGLEVGGRREVRWRELEGAKERSSGDFGRNLVIFDQI